MSETGTPRYRTVHQMQSDYRPTAAGAKLTSHELIQKMSADGHARQKAYESDLADEEKEREPRAKRLHQRRVEAVTQIKNLIASRAPALPSKK